jgi:hypothetical protein
VLRARASIALHGVRSGEVVPGTIQAHGASGRRSPTIALVQLVSMDKVGSSTYTRNVTSVVGGILQLWVPKTTQRTDQILYPSDHQNQTQSLFDDAMLKGCLTSRSPEIQHNKQDRQWEVLE